jgi:uroporphyrinogen-III synthase
MAILVIRSDDEFSRALREAGHEVIDLELIETRPVEDLSELREKLSRISEYDGVFFTSPAAAKIFVRERKGTNGFYGSVYALGRRAQKVLASAGLNLKPAVAANTSEEMLNEFGDDEFIGRRFLFVCGEKSLRAIPERLAGKATVDEVAVYNTETKNVPEDQLKDLRRRLENNEIEFVCFFSPSGVRRFAELFGEGASNITAASIGTTTAEVAKRTGFNVDYISPNSNAADFARGLIEHLKTIA